MSGTPDPARTRFNLQTLGKLAVLAGLMFGFGFAMVPLYKKICEVTGINFLTKGETAIRTTPGKGRSPGLMTRTGSLQDWPSQFDSSPAN